MLSPIQRAIATLLPLTAAATLAHAAAPAATHPGVVSALAHAQAHAKAAGGDAFTARDLIVDADGSTHTRLHRTHFGLRVIGGDVVIHAGAAGEFRSASQTLAAPIALASRVPALKAEGAKTAALALFGGKADSVKTELVVYAREHAPVLAWDVLVTGETLAGLPSEAHLIIDARSKALLDRYDDVQTVDAIGTGTSLYSGTVTFHTDLQSNGTYALKDATRGNHTVYDLKNKNGQFTQSTGTLMTDADNVWGDGVRSKTSTSDGVDAMYGQNMTWDFYKNVFGRNGIANDGRGGYSRVHSKGGALFYNAFWSDSCFCMTYSSGNSVSQPALVSIDVAGHEMTHGVTANSAGLIYSKESGGLNEGTSDIMGTMVEFYTNNAKDKPDYLMGEQMGTPLRYLYNPSKDGSSADCWYSTVGNLDVHYSSGVANHLYYLLAEGTAPADGPTSPTCKSTDTRVATGTGSLTGIGRDKAQAIWYRALTVYMTSSTNYAAARVATLAAAADLYGGVGSATWNAVAAAWTAVNVN